MLPVGWNGIEVVGDDDIFSIDGDRQVRGIGNRVICLPCLHYVANGSCVK